MTGIDGSDSMIFDDNWREIYIKGEVYAVVRY